MRNIILAGFMGTGKTTVGKRLSEIYHLDFIDTDELIEKKAGNKKVCEIFDELGEDHFRDLEKDVIRDIAKRENAVVATGGGAIVNSENFALLKENSSIILCLTARPEVIISRIKNENGIRPLLKVKNPLKKIEELLNSRKEAYLKTDLMIDTSDMSLREVVEKIGLILKEKGIAKP